MLKFLLGTMEMLLAEQTYNIYFQAPQLVTSLTVFSFPYLKLHSNFLIEI